MKYIKNRNTREIKKSLHVLNTAIADLARMKMDYCNTYGVVRDIDHIVTQLNIVRGITNYKHRLPLYDIEQAVIKLYRQDPNLQGVIIPIYFRSGDGVIDKSKLGNLEVYL